MNLTETTILFNKVYGTLVGGLIGDAMGAPAEDLHYDEIREKFGLISDFEGAGTDDSAIKQILCDAIIANEGRVTADEFAESFLNNKSRYYDLFFIPVKNMFHKIESGLTLPVYAGYGNMHSSSSAMSIAPLGIINACNPRQAAVETWDAAGLIHAGNSTFCRDGACAVAAAVAEAISSDSTVDSVLEASTAYLHRTSSAEMRDQIEQAVETARGLDDYEEFRARYYENNLRDIVSDSRETVPCVLALFYLAAGDPVRAIIYGANFGRDADTIGTMVGAVSGAFKGAGALRRDWVEKIESNQRKPLNDSKNDGIEITLTDQRELARRLIGIVQSRVREEAALLARLERLSGSGVGE